MVTNGFNIRLAGYGKKNMIALINETPEILAWAIGWQEMVLVMIVVLLLFGGKKLPELARGLARGLKVFKDELKGVKNEIDKDQADKNSISDKSEEPESNEKPYLYPQDSPAQDENSAKNNDSNDA